MAIRMVDQMLSDMGDRSPFGPRLSSWRFNAARKCSTASLKLANIYKCEYGGI